MPVGLALGGAAIGGIATVASGAMGAHAQEKAADKAADTSLQVAEQNNALYRDIYGQNKALLTPYSNNGLLASNALTDLLLGTHTFNPSGAPAAGGTQRAPVVSRTPVSGGGALSDFATTPNVGPGTYRMARQPGTGRLIDQMGGFGNDLAVTAHTPRTVVGGRYGGGALEGAGARPVAPPPGTVTTTPRPAAGSANSGSAAPSALSAWDQFRQGTNYQWRFNEGMRGVTGAYATKGALDSGAAEKAKIEFGQNFASNELSNYMNLLASQQAMGLSAAGAVAGVGTSYAGNVAAQNTNAANAAANAALVGGQGAANMWAGVGQGVGQLGGALFQYGMGQAMPRTTYAPASSSPIIMNPNPTPGALNFAGTF